MSQEAVSIHLKPRTSAVQAEHLEELIGIFLAERQALGAKLRTIDNYRWQLAPFVAWWTEYAPAHDYCLSREALQCFYAWLATDYVSEATGQPLAANTRRSACRRVRQVLHWLYASDRLDRDISHWLPLPKPERHLKSVLTVEQLQALMNATAGANRIRDMAILAFLAGTGSRLSETANAQIPNLVLHADKSGYCSLHKTKGDRPRVVVFGPATGRLLELYLWAVNRQEGRLFDLTDTGIKLMLRRLSERAGVEVTAHVFRRTFATYWIENFGGDREQAMYFLKLQLGHATRDVTEVFYLMGTHTHIARVYISPVEALCLPGLP